MKTENALLAIESKWLLKELGKPVETINDMYRRVARTVSKKDPTKYPFYLTFLKEGWLYPNSPCMTNAGTGLGMLSACFVLPLVDDMGKEKNGIFDTLRNAALIQQAGGGIGFDFSALRPAGSVVHSSGGVSSGPIGFMRVYNSAFSEISQGGVRRGANIAVMRCDHPDILEFIRSKSTEGEMTCFNISVAITDEFMRKVGAGDEQSVSLLREIAEHSKKNGEPGIIFIDEMNRYNPLPLKPYSACNPCGEMPLHPFDSCNLGHLNLVNYLIGMDKDEFDWGMFAAHINVAVMFLDDVIDVNKYVPSVPELRETALNHRRIGLGIMGLADVLFALKVRYGSPAAMSFAYQLTRFMRYHAMLSSQRIAREKGPFPAFGQSIYASPWRPNKKPSWVHEYDFGCPELDWSKLYASSTQLHPLRNSSLLTIAPTGTTGTAADVEGYGCEPAFALAYTRHILIGDERKPMRYTSNAFNKALDDYQSDHGMSNETIDLILEKIDGGCQKVLEVPAEIKHVFVTANDLSMQEHINMQAALQVHVDSAISKTINCPPNTTAFQIEQGIKYAHLLGLKGITFYVDGSRDTVVLEKNTCPECGSALEISEGCKHCPSCGWGGCSL